MSEPRWRVGRTLGRTLYKDGVCVGLVDTPELAAEIVEAMTMLANDDRRMNEYAEELSRQHESCEAKRRAAEAERDELRRALADLADEVESGVNIIGTYAVAGLSLVEAKEREDLVVASLARARAALAKAGGK